jgi:CRISPR-associated protein Cmx8
MNEDQAESQAGDTKAKRPRRPRAKAKGAPDADAVLELTWNLHELPSSQHKAGLAGLALYLRFLERKPDRKGVCVLKSLDANGLTLSVDRAGMQGLFDDVYDASLEEQESKTKQSQGGGEDKQERPVKRVEERVATDPKTKKTKVWQVFIYDQVVPRGSFIDDLDSGTDKLWLKLWRQLVWSVFRAKPATREPYNSRAGGCSSSVGLKIWNDLSESPNGSVRMASTYAIGMQEFDAENVPVRDTERFRLLLHFWPFVAAVYVPATLERDGTREFNGFAVVIPEVADLSGFVEDWPVVARARSNDAMGYRPRDAVIDVAGEGGLDVFRRCLDVVSAKQGRVRTVDWVAAVDVFHLERDGNNVRLRSLSRVDPERTMIDEYARVRGNYWSPVFRRQRIGNVLDHKPWWWGFARLCALTPRELSIENDSFRHDCRLALTEVEMKQDASDTEAPTLEHLIYRRIQAYVLGKTERKFELSWAGVQGNPAKEKEYREKKEKVGREAFLAVRSRTGADFVAYFTSTICSVPHHASEEKYLQVARALMDPGEVERVRSLTLLALSALS